MRVVDDGYSRTRKPVPDAEIGFTPDTVSVDVRGVDREDSKLWELLAGFDYQAARGRFSVNIGQRTDFASVPRLFVWFIPAYGQYTKAAILHDMLCDMAEKGQMSRRDADGMFRQALRILGVSFLRRWVMWVGVRLGALMTTEGRKGWIRDAPVIVPSLLVLSPILLPPAFFIAVALLAWHVLELLAWIPLELYCEVKTRRREATKKVNRPALTFRM